MPYEKRPGTGAIFKNEKRAENHPDYRGNIITPSGEELDIALWVKTAQSGKKYFSCVIQEPYKKDENTQAAEPSKPYADDLPF